jgi:ribosomal protein S18 acetylase RimI-like enzyme
VWNNPSGPRLGLIGVLRAHRRRGLARALLAHVFAVLHERDEATVTAEVDDGNGASTTLIRSLGARRTGGTVECVRR